MITRRSFAAGIGAAGGVLAARSLGAPAIAAPSGTLRVAIFADPLTLDPHSTGNLQGRATCRAVHDTLFTIDATGRLAPGLVESWEQPDAQTYLLRLRQGIKFHDGTPFDAEAVRYNLARIRTPPQGLYSARKDEFLALDRVDVVDAGTLKITLKYPFVAFLFPLTDVSGCIGSPTAFERWGLDYGFHPAGTGPFRLAEYAKDNRTVLERNPDYWDKGKPGVDQIVLRPIVVDSTRLAELRAGGVDIAEALPLQDIRRLRQAREFVVSEKQGFRWEYFGFNLRDEYPGRSKKFRQAFQWAIDREALHQVAYFGTGSVGYDGILPGTPFNDPQYRPFQRDMDKAKRLIEESGVTLPVTLRAPLQPDPVKQRAAQLFQATAAELGVKVEIEPVDSASYRATLSGGKMPVDLFGWFGYRPDPDQYLTVLIDSAGSYARFNAYANPEMDRLMLAQRRERVESERRKIFRQISDLMNDDAAYVPWHYSSDFKGLAAKVKGFEHAQDGIIVYRDLYLG